MKRKVLSRFLAMGMAASMLLGNSIAAFADDSAARFTAKDGVIDEQPGDVFYEIFVRAFRDSNGDSIGDFKGVEEMVPYLADLGITGIWLMPITDSGSEHCYDVRNYYEVNSDYGTMEDFQSMLDTCHKHGIKVIMDLVVNHCGYDNVWFQEALKGPTLEDGSEILTGTTSPLYRMTPTLWIKQPKKSMRRRSLTKRKTAAWKAGSPSILSTTTPPTVPPKRYGEKQKPCPATNMWAFSAAVCRI